MTKPKPIIGLLAVLFFVFFTEQLYGYEFRHGVRFSQEELQFGKLTEYDLVKLKGGSVLAELTKPMLPSKELRIALPRGMEAKRVYVVDERSETIPGEYNVFPAQPPIRVGSPEADFVEPDDQIYSSNQPYPTKLAEFVRQSDLAGQGIVHIMLYPLQYIPSERRLTLYTSFTVVIECASGYKYGDRLSPNTSEKSRREYEQMIKDMVANPEDVQLGPVTRLSGSTSLNDDTLDHVIITSSSYASYFQPLVNWHIQRGLRDTVITTDSIYANYSGSSNQEKIRNFIIDARSTWGTTYFLLAGEHGTVPFEYRTYYGENTPSDQYYSDYDDDWVHEVFVGRVTVGSTTQINTFIDKVLKYEKDPPRTDYPLDVLLIGMDLDPSTHAELLKETIDNYIPPQFNVTKVYDSHSGNHKTAAINALNAGQNLVNHADHAYINILGTGDYWHNWGIYNSDVNALTNNNQMSVVVSLGCHPNHMDYNDCIAEYFVIYNPYQAGVAFTGNTRDGWGYVGYPEELSGKLDKEWWIGLFSRNKYNLGQTLVDSKHHFSTGWPDDDLKEHCEWTFNLLGEPEMPIWTDAPDSFAVSCRTTFCLLQDSSFSVHVQDSTTHAAVNQAYVCLWKGTEVYLTGHTNSSGDITFSPSPSSAGTMYVTVTKHNYIPGEREVIVEDFIRGDVDGGGSINVTDITYLVDYLFGDGPEPVPYLAGDCDCDDSVNVADLTYLVDYLFGGGPPPGCWD